MVTSRRRAFALSVFIVALLHVAHARQPCAFMLDSAAILSNRNLPPFITSLARDTFILLNHREAIPLFIHEEIHCLLARELDSMLNVPLFANPGERFSGSCIVEDGIPLRGLAFIAMSNDMLAIMFDQGGIAYIRTILLVRFKRDRITDIWGGHGGHDVRTPKELARFLRKRMKEHWGLNTNRLFF